jgi:hypothetical protein
VSTYRIAWNAERQVWSVYVTGEFARYVASFPTLAEAEAFCTRGEGSES